MIHISSNPATRMVAETDGTAIRLKSLYPESHTTRIMIPSDASHEQIELIPGAMYLTLADMFQHLTGVEGSAAAQAYKAALLTRIKDGGVATSLLDDAATYDFVVARVDGSARFTPDTLYIPGSAAASSRKTAG